MDVPPIKSPENIPAIDIMNKSDLLSDSQSKHLKRAHHERIFLSAKTEDNVHLLKQQIKISLGVGGSLSDTVTTTTSRQHNALKDCHNKLNAATELLNSPRCAYEIIAIELREALDAVGVILGKTTPDDILHNIFNQFCVGK